MKIHIANFEKGRMGGGWSFQGNFAKAMVEYLSNYDESDIYFVTSASMVERDDVVNAKNRGKKIVLRCDNIIRNSRNRNTGMTRMRDMASIADLVVYQSEFAKGLLNDYLQPQKSIVILNSSDEKIFYPSKNLGHRYLWVRSSSDETKNWELARSKFQAIKDSNKTLTIVGKPLDPKVIEYNFDFYMGEKVNYLGEIHDENTMAEIYRNHDVLLYSYFNDACSNTLIEAILSGLAIEDCYGMINTGGTPEIIKNAYDTTDKTYFYLKRMANEYTEALKTL